MAVTLNAKGTSVSSFQIGKGGQTITLNASGYLTIDDGVDTEQPLGYNTIPIYEIDAADTFDLAHAGMLWHKDSGAAVTFTCDEDATIPQGSTWIVHNDDTEDITIAEGTGVTISFLASGAAPATGNVTVSQGGLVTVYKYTDTEYWVWGDDGPFNILTAGATTDSTLRWDGSAWAENTTVTATSTGILTASSTAGNHTFSVDSATTSAAIPVMRLSASSTGTPLAGIGPSLEFEAETAAANLEIGGTIALEATDVTATSEDFDLVFSTMAAGAAAAERVRITSTDEVILGPDATQPWLTLNSISTGDGWDAQGAGITIGETGAKASGFHITYNGGTGTCWIGSGTVDDTTTTGGTPSQGRMSFSTSSDVIRMYGGFELRDGPTNGYWRFYGPSGTNYVTVDHDNTTLSFAGTSTTNFDITGFTTLNAGTVDADFDAITATSYGGIAEANLLDKTATETITGAYTVENTNGMVFKIPADADTGFIKYDGASMYIGNDRVGGSVYIDAPSNVSILNGANLTMTTGGLIVLNNPAADGAMRWRSNATRGLIETTGVLTGIDVDMQATDTLDIFGGGDVQIRDAGSLFIYDSTDTDSAEFSHDGTDFNTAFTTTTDWNITGANINLNNYTRFYFEERTMPTVVDDTVDIGTLVVNSGAFALALDIVVNDSGFSVGKKYIMAVNYAESTNVWEELVPISDGGPYSSNNYAVDIRVNNGTTDLRIRRTLGSTAGTANCTLQVTTDDQTYSYTPSTTTASVTAPTAYYSATGITTADDVVSVVHPMRVENFAGTDYAEFSHDGTDFNTDFANTSDWNITGLTNNAVSIDDGGRLRIRDSDNNSWVLVAHDGTDLNVSLNNSTDINMTSGITAVNLPEITLTTALDETYGGTGQTTFTTGDILYASAANTLSKLAAGTNTHVLTLTGGVPTWAAAPGAGSISGTVADNQIVTGTGASTVDSSANLTFDGSTFAVVGASTFTTDSATTNSDIPVITLRATSTGTPAAGIGPSIEFEAETSAGAPGNIEIGGVLALAATDVTATSEDFDFVFQTMAAGAAAAERARITSTGNVTATSFNGVALTTGGSATNFLNETGSYSAPPAGTVTSVDITAGTLIDKTGGPITTSGSITIDVDLSEATEAVYAPATDYLLFLDGGVTGTAAKESGVDFAAALAGTGLTASSGTLTVDDVALGTSTTGNYVATITGGTGIDSTGATTGEGIAHTLSVDLGEVTAVVFDPAVDFVPIIDGGATGTTQKDAWADIATAIAGTGITATSGVLSADNNGTVTSIGITAGTLIDVTGSPVTTSGNITVDVDLSEATEAVYAPATDYLLFLDGGVTGTAAKESGADFATALAGTGLTATSGVLSVDSAPTEATVTTTTATQTELLAYAIASGTSVGYTATIVGRQDATGDTVMERVQGLISNEAGTTALIGTPGVDRHEAAGASAWAVTVAADDTSDELTFDVTGEASHTIDWKIKLEVVVV